MALIPFFALWVQREAEAVSRIEKVFKFGDLLSTINIYKFCGQSFETSRVKLHMPSRQWMVCLQLRSHMTA